MRTHLIMALVVVGAAGLLSVPGCGTVGAGAPGARTAIDESIGLSPAPPSARQIARLVRQFWWDDQSGTSPSPGQVREVSVLEGSFTAPAMIEAIAAFRSGSFREDAWQAWLLQWRAGAWHVVRPVATSCEGRIEPAAIEPGRPAALIVRDSCTRFGREEGQVRVIGVGLTTNVERFAAAESADPDARTGMLVSQHEVHLADLDGDGVSEIVDTAEAVYRLEEPDDFAEVTFATKQRTIYKRTGGSYLAVQDTDGTPANLYAGLE